ncbi:exodeoxyribonuclease V subunit gamma, partial [Escherichia sp. TWPC-MK]
LPASFIWDMFVRVLPEIPKESAFNKQSMSWKLMTLLPQLLDREDFTLLRLLTTDDSGNAGGSSRLLCPRVKLA